MQKVHKKIIKWLYIDIYKEHFKHEVIKIISNTMKIIQIIRGLDYNTVKPP